ncbi:hypothetical protein ACLOJK_039107 [Asimina triloba]
MLARDGCHRRKTGIVRNEEGNGEKREEKKETEWKRKKGTGCRIKDSGDVDC